MTEIIKIIKRSGVGVMPTDTIYALVGSALSKKSVLRIYKTRKRDLKKPFIVLIENIKDLKKFGVKTDERVSKFLKNVWPGPVSIILSVKSKKFFYLHRGTNSIAFRMPKELWLKKILRKTGPLVAPSANMAGKPPAQTIQGAKKYFGEGVDFYLDGGKISKQPSLLIDVKR
ncbi:MAG: L-threonylcarbamoyladenylate synthase [Patescibacteria group bacterium]